MNAPYTWTGNCCSVINTEPKPKVGTPPPRFPPLFNNILMVPDKRIVNIFFNEIKFNSFNNYFIFQR